MTRAACPLDMRIALVLVLVVACATATPPGAELGRPTPRVAVAGSAPRPSSEPTVAALIAALTTNDRGAVASLFEPGSGVSADAVGAVWDAKRARLGGVISSRTTLRSRQDGFDTRVVELELEHGAIACLVSIAPDTAKLASIFFTRPAPPARYIDAGRFTETPITVGAAPYVLDGTLTLPAGDRVPGVVLVHGSGPNDRDETVGANQPFKDLAEGLASSGIAVLRYDKRTYRYGDVLTDTITLDQEVVDDAVDAVRALAARPEIDPKRIYVIGHSLGGLLAPEIATRAGTVAGLVLLAPPARAPWDIVLSQMRYLAAPRETLVAVEKAITLIDIGGGEGTEILGVPYAYWHDWASRDGIAVARRLARPILVLHGDRDYQVLDEDFALWRTGLAGTRDVTFATLAGVNHLFVRGSGRPGPAEYKVPDHVDPRAIDRIVTFIRRH